MIVPLLTGSHILCGLWACVFICCCSTHPRLRACSVALWARSSRIFLKKSKLTLIAYNFLMSFLLVGWGGVFHENTYIEKIQEKAILHTVKNMQIKVYNIYINIIKCFSLMTQIQKFFTYIIISCARTIMTKIIIFWLSLSFNSQSYLFI